MTDEDGTGSAPRTRYVDSQRAGTDERFSPPRTHHARELRRAFANVMMEVVGSDEVPGGKRVVDLGCGARAFESLLMTKFDEYLGVDLPGNALADLAVRRDGSVPLEDSSADCVVSTQVIEHVEDVGVYLEEVQRLLVPRGTLIISTNGHYRYHPDPVDLWRWTAEGLRAELTRAGFHVRLLRSVLRGPSAAVLLWQLTTVERVPHLFRPLYQWLCQTVIATIERRTTGELDHDSVAFLAVATT